MHQCEECGVKSEKVEYDPGLDRYLCPPCDEETDFDFDFFPENDPAEAEWSLFD